MAEESDVRFGERLSQIVRKHNQVAVVDPYNVWEGFDCAFQCLNLSQKALIHYNVFLPISY